MSRIGTIVIAIIALIAVVAVAGLNLFEQPPPDNVTQEPPHRVYLRDYVTGMELTFDPVVRNNFTYYRLHSADKELAGFVFLGTEEGWGGPINLFVKTDAAGIIQRVYVWHHTETPIWIVGLDEFLATFAGYRAEADLIWQKDVHGITGATVTAEAIIAAVHEAGRTAYQKGIFIGREK
jgi:Na+-translocating ferredoxin:NAD+ oxidoreductase RnfG subunit